MEYMRSIAMAKRSAKSKKAGSSLCGLENDSCILDPVCQADKNECAWGFGGQCGVGCVWGLGAAHGEGQSETEDVGAVHGGHSTAESG